MRIIRLGGMAFAGALGFAAATPVAAVTIIMDFSGNICGAAGNEACANGAPINQRYADVPPVGNDPAVDVSYRGFNANTGITTEAFLKHWGTGYGDLQHVAWTGSDASNFTAEITFTPLAGSELRVLGFDAGCYLNSASCRSFGWTLTNLSGGMTNGTVTPPPGGHDTEVLDLAYSSTGWVLRWGPDAYNGGLSNIAFDVRRIAGVIPEPSSWALLILGFGLVGGAMRKRPLKIALA